jgi:hypothetical protein
MSDDQSDRVKRLSRRLSPSTPSTDDRAPADRAPETGTPETVHGTTKPGWEETHHRTTFWLADDLRAAIKEAAEAEGLSLRKWVDKAFRQALERGSATQ